jgi:aspartate dehydrogenase
MTAERIALIGFGAIGQAVALGLAAGMGDLHALGPPRPGAPQGRGAQEAAGERAGPGQEAVRSCAAGVLGSGTHLMIVSMGALASPGFLDELLAAAAPSAQLPVPAGAIAGLDGLGALKLAGLNRVTYTSIKPPLAWRGTPAERILPLDALQERTIFFEGSAREAALNYPKNANLAATVALAGLGFDETRVQLVADPAAQGNTGRIEADSEIGTMTVVMAGRASANPKTSASTAFSLLHAIHTRSAQLVI